jgi:hypothetical protein
MALADRKQYRLHYQWALHYIHRDIRGSEVPEAQTEDRNATSTTVRRTPTYGSQHKAEHHKLSSHTPSDQTRKSQHLQYVQIVH